MVEKLNAQIIAAVVAAAGVVVVVHAVVHVVADVSLRSSNMGGDEACFVASYHKR